MFIISVHNRLVSLVGEKPVLKCKLNEVPVKGLWDTGSQVSMINIGWFKDQFPDEKVVPGRIYGG